ncbi:MAG: hypothetical protein KME22_01855 [Hassallia sp. WJT32-NPBG1]|jgi:hypothetical protein|nr:hypothetical protein [Hassallia sp. WJT32-NPBG1]
MPYKIRRLKNHVQVCRGLQGDKTWQLEKTIDNLKEQIESLNLELFYKSYEVEKMRQSRYMEHEVYSMITSMLLKSDDENELSKNLLACDRLINNVLSELYDAIFIYNSSVQKQ